MTAFARELRELRVGLSSRMSEDEFVSRVLTECANEPDRVVEPAQALTRTWPYGVALAAAACVGLAIAAWPVARPPEAAPGEGQVAARGNGNTGLSATVQAFVGHAAPGAPPPLLEGAELRPGDGILVRYSNPTAHDVYLAVFAVDQRGSVHWIHPAYLDAATNPLSLRLAAGTTERVLPEIAEPEGAAPGALRVYALLSATPLDVKRVEARLGDKTRSVAELFSEAEVEEWRCSWQAR
jgi:hypothetical protein